DNLIMPACDEYNRGTNTDDLVAAVVSRWNYNSGETIIVAHRKLPAHVGTQHPENDYEWTPGCRFVTKLKAMEDLENHGVRVPIDAVLIKISPLTIRRLNLFAHKVVLALYFEEFKVTLTDTGRVSAYWRTKEDFAQDGVPRVLLEMMDYYGTIEQGRWTVK